MDKTVKNQWSTENVEIFKRLGARTEVYTEDLYAHLMPMDPGRYVNKWMYENLQGTVTGYSEKADKDWAKNGYWGKFDQSLYTNGATTKDLRLREWGFWYYPEECMRGGCNAQIVYHGCFDSAEGLLDLWAPWASTNKLVLVLPQAEDCWMVHGGSIFQPKDYPKEYFTK